MLDHAGRPFEAGLDVGDGTIIVAFRGEFDLLAAERASTALAGALAAEAETIVVDLREASHIRPGSTASSGEGARRRPRHAHRADG